MQQVSELRRMPHLPDISRGFKSLRHRPSQSLAPALTCEITSDVILSDCVVLRSSVLKVCSRSRAPPTNGADAISKSTPTEQGPGGCRNSPGVWPNLTRRFDNV